MIMETDSEPEPRDKEATFGIDGEMPFLCVADLGDLFCVHYHLRQRYLQLQKERGKDENSIGVSPSEDAAMVRASVEVTMVDDLSVEDPETASSDSVAELSVMSKSEKTSSTAASSDCHVSNSNRSKKLSLAQRYASSVAANPKRHLYTTLLICAILTLAAIVGALVTELTPDVNFRSWLTRGTLISSRTQQLINLYENMEQKDEFFLEDGQRVDIKDPPNSAVVCSGQWYGSPYMTENQQLKLTTVWKTQDESQNALDSEALYQMCMNEKHVLESMEEHDLCYKCPVESNEGSRRQERCIQPYSLVAAARLYLQAVSTWSIDFTSDIYLQPSLSCEDLRNAWTKTVQSDFTNVLLDCTDSLLAEYNLRESVSDPPTCLLPDAKIVASLVDVNFPTSGKVEYTAAIYASKQDTDSLDELYKLDKSGSFSQEGDALTGHYEVGFQPLYLNPDGGFYMRDIHRATAMDILLGLAAGLASCVVAGWHTKSVYLTLFGLLQIILALPITWVLYRFVLGFEWLVAAC
jgi:hypothetical protein